MTPRTLGSPSTASKHRASPRDNKPKTASKGESERKSLRRWQQLHSCSTHLSSVACLGAKGQDVDDFAVRSTSSPPVRRVEPQAILISTSTERHNLDKVQPRHGAARQSRHNEEMEKTKYGWGVRCALEDETRRRFGRPVRPLSSISVTKGSPAYRTITP